MFAEEMLNKHQLLSCLFGHTYYEFPVIPSLPTLTLSPAHTAEILLLLHTATQLAVHELQCKSAARHPAEVWKYQLTFLIFQGPKQIRQLPTCFTTEF